jgi:hypothetical protein
VRWELWRIFRSETGSFWLLFLKSVKRAKMEAGKQDTII